MYRTMMFTYCGVILRWNRFGMNDFAYWCLFINSVVCHLCVVCHTFASCLNCLMDYMPFGGYTCGVQWHIVLDGGSWSPWGLNPQTRNCTCRFMMYPKTALISVIAVHEFTFDLSSLLSHVNMWTVCVAWWLD